MYFHCRYSFSESNQGTCIIYDKSEDGHISVKEEENQSLYSWCQLAKTSLLDSEGKKSKKLSLTEDRLRQLKAIGFELRIIHKK